jgi:hypothetical protein
MMPTPNPKCAAPDCSLPGTMLHAGMVPCHDELQGFPRSAVTKQYCEPCNRIALQLDFVGEELRNRHDRLHPSIDPAQHSELCFQDDGLSALWNIYRGLDALLRASAYDDFMGYALRLGRLPPGHCLSPARTAPLEA